MLFMILAAATVPAQGDRSTGGLKGKVRVEKGSSAGGVLVTLLEDEREIARSQTDQKGAFIFNGLKPGVYLLSFRKPGLTTGTLSNVQVRAGKVTELSDRLYMSVDEGSIAFLRGSVFDPVGRSVPGVRVELARVAADGSLKKLDSRQTTESGQFVFRLTPDAATYRVTVKANGIEPVMKDVEIDGAAIYRIALTLTPPTQ